MKHNIFEIITGTLVLACAIGFFLFSFSKTDISTKSQYKIITKFDNVDGVSVGSDVKISGVKVGDIYDLTLDKETYRAKVILSIDNDIKLPSDSSIKISSSGLLGGKYISIELGSDEEMLEDGGEIFFSQSSVNFEDLLGKFIFGSKDKSGK